LDSGTYIVKGNSTISSNATLGISSGTKILFEPNARVHVMGGLHIDGKANHFVEITSSDKTKQGFGFVITEVSNTSISLNYTHFHGLTKPIQINKNWGRNSISITHNQFSELHGSGIYMEIQEMDKIRAKNIIPITINRNTFSNNSGSILLAECSSELLKLTISNNVFSRNEFVGRDMNGVFTIPIFLNYNTSKGHENSPIISNNSICYNYGSLILADTAAFFPTYLSVVGNAKFLNIKHNYFGESDINFLENFENQLISSGPRPTLVYNDTRAKPDSDLNGHIYKVSVNRSLIDPKKMGGIIDENTRLLEFVSNRAIAKSPDFKLSYIYLENDTFRYQSLSNDLDFKLSNKKLDITLKDSIVITRPFGYIKLEGLVDQNGFMVPSVNIGLKNFLFKNRLFVSGYNNFVKIPKLIQSKPLIENSDSQTFHEDLASDSGEIVISNEIESKNTLLREKYWDFGVFTGSTIYFGDLAQSTIALYVPNARPNIGFRVGYNVSKLFRVEFSQNNMLITGDDDRASTVGKLRGTNLDRGLSFRTWIYDLGISAEYRLEKFDKTSNIVPSIYAGVCGYYFDPQAKVDGVYYSLRTVGTEGQTSNGSTYAYGRFGISIPIGIKLTRHINKLTLVSVSYTYNKLFTDYLDDVSTGVFQSDEDLIKYNSDLNNVAVKLGNPNGISAGLQRSSSGDFDGYSYFGITITRKLLPLK
jgi:hypothetical protein